MSAVAYVAKPTRVEAWQMNGTITKEERDALFAWCRWVRASIHGYIVLETTTGDEHLEMGDWIVRDLFYDSFSVVSDLRFKRLYEPAGTPVIWQ